MIQSTYMVFFLILTVNETSSPEHEASLLCLWRRKQDVAPHDSWQQGFNKLHDVVLRGENELFQIESGLSGLKKRLKQLQ